MARKTTRKRNGFKKGSGCFTCVGCGKKTRATGGNDNEHLKLCVDCYECSGDENAVQDGHMTQAEFDERWPVGHPSREDTDNTTPAPMTVEPTKFVRTPTKEEMKAAADILADHVRNLLNQNGVDAAVDGNEDGTITIKTSKGTDTARLGSILLNNLKK